MSHESDHEHGRHGNPADLDAYLARLESPERAQWQMPDRVVAALGVKAGQTVADIGTGPGYFSLRLARKVGPRGRVFAVDVEADRLDLARRLGADVVLDPQKADVAKELAGATEGRGADVAFEAVGIAATVKTAIAAVRRGATVTLVGNVSPTVELPLQAVVTRQLRLQGSCSIAGEYPAALAMIERGLVNVDAMRSAVAPLSEGAAWFDRLYRKERGLMKVILKP